MAGTRDIFLEIANSIKYLSKRVRKLETQVGRAINDRIYVYVKDFGALGDGTTDDTAALQAAWDSLPAVTQSRAVLEFEPGRTYLITDQLNFRDKSMITILGNHAQIVTSAGVDYSGKCLVSFAGSAYLDVRDFYIASNSYAVMPVAGMVLGRTASFHGGFFYGQRICITGYYSYASYYNVGSEVSTFISCIFENNVAGARAALIGNDDIAGLIGVDAGQLTGYYYGCVFHSFGAGGHCIVLRGYVAEHCFFGCYGVPGLGGHFVHCEAGTGAMKQVTNCTFDNIRSEMVTGDNSDTRFIYQNSDEAFAYCTIRNIGWNMYSGVAADDPDYMYEFHGGVTLMKLFGDRGEFGKKMLLIKSTAVLTSCEIHGSIGSGGVRQVTVEAGATHYRCGYFWDETYPFDATPANTNLIQWVKTPVKEAAIAIANGDTTPTLGNGSVHELANLAPTTITDFDDVATGDVHYILSGDFDTTLDFTGTNLKGNDGVDYLIVYPDMLIVTRPQPGGYKFVEIIKA